MTARQLPLTLRAGPQTQAQHAAGPVKRYATTGQCFIGNQIWAHHDYGSGCCTRCGLYPATLKL